MAVIYEGTVNTKLIFKIESIDGQGNVLSVLDKKTGEVKGQTPVYVSNPRIAPDEDEVTSWNSIATGLATA
jgi:hypothetical protein